MITESFSMLINQIWLNIEISNQKKNFSIKILRNSVKSAEKSKHIFNIFCSFLYFILFIGFSFIEKKWQNAEM